MQAGYASSNAAPLWDRLVFNKIKAAFGGKLKLCINGAAPMTPETETFMRVAMAAVGLQGYGLTETCSATCAALPDRWEMFQTVRRLVATYR